MEEPKLTHMPRILLLSRDLAGKNHLCAELALSGWRVIQVADAMEAFAAVVRQGVDLALLQMPVDEMIQMDLPGVMRKISSHAYLPVIVLAQDVTEEQRCRFLDCGADSIITTSDLSAAELISQMKAMLRIRELHDQLNASSTALEAALQRERRLLAKLRSDNAQLYAMTVTDPLTHVQNIRSFQDILQHEFRTAKRYDQSLSLLALDVDHFKVVNDTYGHPTGDYVLKELAVVLKQSVRESDVVARTGGEEFSIILPRAGGEQAKAFADRIRSEVSQRLFDVYGHQFNITVSLGVATYPQDAEIIEPEMLWYFADQALLLAKEYGRNCVVTLTGLELEVRQRLRRQYKIAAYQAHDEVAPEQVLQDPRI